MVETDCEIKWPKFELYVFLQPIGLIGHHIVNVRNHALKVSLVEQDMDTRSKQETVKPIRILNWALEDLKFNFQKEKWRLANVIQTEIVS